MTVASLLAKHLRDVHTGGNWTSVNLRDTLADVSLAEAFDRQPGFNSIAALTYHIHYYVAALVRVLHGRPLDAHDRYSFDHPPLDSEEDWEALREQSLAAAADAAAAVERLPEALLDAPFTDPKYGTYYRNIQGTIEHAHYHLGQIVLLKKRLRQGGH